MTQAALDNEESSPNTGNAQKIHKRLCRKKLRRSSCVRKRRRRKMGTSHSVHAPKQAAAATGPSTESVTSKNDIVNPEKRPKKERKGFDLVQYKCRRRKAAYHVCYNEWYQNRFLSADDINRDESCDDLFEKWRECILKGMLKERQREGLPPPKEGSILSEFIEEQGDE